MARVFKCFTALLFLILITMPSLEAKPSQSDKTGKKETAEDYFNKGFLCYEKGDDLSAVELLGKVNLLDADKKYSGFIEYCITNLNWKASGDMENGDRRKDVRILEETIKYFPALKAAGYAGPVLLDDYTVRLNKIKSASDESVDTATKDELTNLTAEISSFKDAYSGRTVPPEVDRLLNGCNNQAPRIKEICEKKAKIEEEKRAEELKAKKAEQEKLAREKQEALKIKKEERARQAQEKQAGLTGEPVNTNN
jgi:hypothetical protein